MKPGKVRGLEPTGPLADNAERIVDARLSELCGFVPDILDVRRVSELQRQPQIKHRHRPDLRRKPRKKRWLKKAPKSKLKLPTLPRVNF